MSSAVPKFMGITCSTVGSGGRTVSGIVLQPLDYWDRKFESR